MNNSILLYFILIPAIAGILALAFGKTKGVKEALALAAGAVNLYIAIALFGKTMHFTAPWAAFGIDFSLRFYNFSSFILLAVAGIGLLVAFYSAVFMYNKPALNQYYAYFLITVAMVNGAALADNIILLLFFWEGLTITLFGLIYIGNKNAFHTAVKAVVISGVSDLCFMAGIILTAYLSHTLTISSMHVSLDGWGALAFVLMMIGATAKAGSMPFHSWIPDAAVDAPLPFMALLPAALEKLLGIYFLTRITLDLFKLQPNHWLSLLMMIIGAAGIVLAVSMALIQKDYKRLLSYHAISQVGYMILGIGTCTPVGIIGGIFHMINNVIYKCGLFLTAGAVEKQTGTTDLKKLGGLFSKMPITGICFLILAASISGVPPFNGFFSKELVYDGALERGWIFYAAALLGSFLTAASFLKLGHAAYFDPVKKENAKVKETPFAMALPMIILAGFCILFGLYNKLPIKDLIQPILGEHLLEGKNFYGWPHSLGLVLATVVVLIAAVLNHIYGVKKSGSGAGASDHIHHAPGLNEVYDMAEKRYFDPYDIGLKIVNVIAKIAFFVDRAIDWIYEKLTVAVTYALSALARSYQNGNYSYYILWSILGVLLIIVTFFRMLL